MQKDPSPRLTRMVWAAALALPVAGWPGARADDAPREPVDAARIRAHVEFLASDSLGGRDSGEPGLEVAAEYISEQFRLLGLAPEGDDGTFFQHFTVPFGAQFGRIAGAEVALPKGSRRLWRPRTDVVPFGFGGSSVVDAPVVFVGYGITTGEEDKKAGLSHDDYAGVDVKGKVVVILRFVPRHSRGGDPFGGRRSPHAALASKLRNARDHGAAAAVLLTPPSPRGTQKVQEGTEGQEDDIYGLAHRASPRQPTLPALLARTEIVSDLFRERGKDLSSVVAEIDETLSPRSFELEGVRLRLDTVPGHRVLRNVAARLDGEPGALGRETIVVGAHYDHIGRFGGQVSAKNLGKIHNGADDNASGVAGVLELARVLSRRGAPAGRAVLFLCFSGEEIGLLGSRAWIEAPRRFSLLRRADLLEKAGDPGVKTLKALEPGDLVEPTGERTQGWVEVKTAADDLRGWLPTDAIEQRSGPMAVHRLAAMINLDMIGRARAEAPVSALGAETSPVFASILEEASKKLGLTLHFNAGGAAARARTMGGSDHENFLRRKVPVLFFFTGMHAQYNSPEDDTDTLNFEGVRRILEVVRHVAEVLLRAPERPPFSAPPATTAMAGHGKPKLGIEIDMDFEDEGVRVKTTLEDTPASKAGLQEGDIILGVGEHPVRESKDLLAALEDVPENEDVPLRVRRGAAEQVVRVLFPARRGFRVSFGSVPDYAFAERGVRFEAIREASSAARAGVKAGDVLTRWNGKEIEDVEQWTALLGAHKPGDEVSIVVKRGDQLLELKAKLEARE